MSKKPPKNPWRDCVVCGEQFDWRDIGPKACSAITCSPECRKARIAKRSHEHHVRNRDKIIARAVARKARRRAENPEEVRAYDRAVTARRIAANRDAINALGRAARHRRFEDPAYRAAKAAQWRRNWLRRKAEQDGRQ